MVKKNLFFEIGIGEFSRETIVNEIEACIDNNKKTIFLGLNADCFNISRKNLKYKQILQNSSYYVYPDGSSIIWGLSFLRKIRQERIVTTDLILYLLESIASNEHKYTVTLLGGSNGIADLAMKRLNERFGITAIKNSIEPLFISYDEIKEPLSMNVLEIIKQLKENPTSILFIGLGCPKQEILCHNILHLIPQKVLIPCGGLFNYYAGNHKRAPLWMQQIGFEWLFRLFLEPQRLWKRYLIGNVLFVMRVFKEKMISVFSW